MQTRSFGRQFGVGINSATSDALETLPAWHLFIVVVVGLPVQFAHIEERHYVIIHVDWQQESGLLQNIWLHSSCKIPRLEANSQEKPIATPPHCDGNSLQSYVDDLPMEGGAGGNNHAFALQTSSDSTVEDSLLADIDMPDILGPALGEESSSLAIDWESSPDVCALVQRFVAIILEFGVCEKLV